MERLESSSVTNMTPSLIVELVGPAGAGKTMLSRALSQRAEKALIGAELELRKLEHIPTFVSNVPFLLPVLLRRCPPSRWFTWNEIKAMVYLRGWPRVLRQQASNNGTVVLLDHGPVFKLATLLEFGPERLKSDGYRTWWKTMFRQWASVLDMVIWLDAADADLVERINTRSQRHAVKGKSEREASNFLARYRTSYAQILAHLTTYGQPTVLQFDTSRESVEQIADELLVTLNWEPSGG